MQSLVPVFDSPRPLLPYVRSYPYMPYTGVGYGYGSSLQTTLPLVRTMPEHFPTASGRSDCGGEDESRQAMPPLTSRVFRPVDFERPGAISKRETYCYESQAPTDYEVLEHVAENPQISLVDRELWESFNSAGNEMIVTKPGRRLFPPLCVSIKGLNPAASYEVSLRVVPADNYRYKYLNSTWIPVGESDILQKEAKHIYIHPNSKDPETATGDCWMKKQVNFKNVKISHNPASPHGDLLVHTMHKYVIEIVIKSGDSSTVCACTRFPETTFVAVTSYQNNALTQMKIDNNPFAKGFREKENSSSIGSMYSSPQHSPQTYIPLRIPPICHRPLWIPPLPPSHDKPSEAEQQQQHLEESEGPSASSKLPPPLPVQPLPFPPCCWSWPSYYIAPKQEDVAAASAATVSSTPTYRSLPVTAATGVTNYYGYCNQP